MTHGAVVVFGRGDGGPFLLTSAILPSNMNTPAEPVARIPVSNSVSKVYHRETLSLLPTAENQSLRYWRTQAAQIFKGHPKIVVVEVVVSGRKTDSQFIGRGDTHPPSGHYVIVSSTGGKWGKSRREFPPAFR